MSQQTAQEKKYREQFADDYNKLQEINAKWKHHMISFEEALKVGFPSIDSARFWNATIIFLALVMCDWNEESAVYIHRYFWLLGKILCYAEKPSEKKIAIVYRKAFQDTQPAWKHDMDLITRLSIVWSIKKAIFSSEPHWDDFGCTWEQFVHKCKSAIVGCLDKKDK